MWWDPDKLQDTPLEVIIQRAWDGQKPEIKAKYEAAAEASGRSMWDLLLEAIDLEMQKLDPATAVARARLDALADSAWNPLGKDPRLEGEP